MYASHTDGEDRYSLHLEATSKIPAWVGLLSLEMEAMATQAWLGGRDFLKPVRLGKRRRCRAWTPSG